MKKAVVFLVVLLTLLFFAPEAANAEVTIHFDFKDVSRQYVDFVNVFGKLFTQSLTRMQIKGNYFIGVYEIEGYNAGGKIENFIEVYVFDNDDEIAYIESQGIEGIIQLIENKSPIWFVATAQLKTKSIVRWYAEQATSIICEYLRGGGEEFDKASNEKRFYPSAGRGNQNVGAGCQSQREELSCLSDYRTLHTS